MMTTTKAYLNWSSGKDAMLALHHINKAGDHSIDKLVTTLNAEHNRISMHGVRRNLLQQQADSLGLPLQIIRLSGKLSLSRYNETMERELGKLKEEGFSNSVFGDILLEDLKAYREKQLDKVGTKAIFPLWQKNTKALIEEFLNLGYKAIVVCVNAKMLDKSFCGREIDSQFLRDLPEDVDPCGENGEFHTFVFDGPLFTKPVEFEIGETVMRDYSPSNDDDCFSDDQQDWDTKFWFTDLLPKG